MKSAIGIGSLLMDGLGDTIRVSLTEDPELEIDPCRCSVSVHNQCRTCGQLMTRAGCCSRRQPTVLWCCSSPALTVVCAPHVEQQQQWHRAYVKVVSDAVWRSHLSMGHGHRRMLAGWGERAVATGLGIEEYHETTRDTHDFGRRVGQLPEQRQTDGEVDYRSLLHRDGSVLSAITLEVTGLASITPFGLLGS
jgi:GcpE protein